MRPQPAKTPAPTATPVNAQGHLNAVNLLTDGLSACLTALPHPTFSWQHAQPDDADPARSLQTGYKLGVEDSQGMKFWSSGAVPSPARRGVRYDGPTLDDDTDYAWPETR